MPSDILSFIPQLLAQMKELIEIHNSGKFPEESDRSDSIRSNHFGHILGDFYEVLPEMRSDLYQIFTSDAMQGNALYMLRFLM